VIDTHCHILPAVDDGPPTAADALAMARQAERDGVRLVCATPHVRDDHDVRVAGLADRVRELNRTLEQERLSVRVALGGEVAQTVATRLDDKELRAASYGGAGRWVLLEPGPGPLSERLDAVVDRLAGRGVRCVIGHPERHVTPDLGDRLAALVDRGALVQITAAHLEEADRRQTLLGLAGRGLVHLIGSDAHHPGQGRTTAMSAGLARLAAVPHVRAHLDWIAETAPAALLRGEDPTPPFAAC
jgi:protein-tyrosine phosphatase